MLNEVRMQIGRRNFIRAVATLPATGTLLWKSRSMRPVRAALVGCGGQGRLLLENAPTTHVQVVGVCDVAPDNLERGLEIARKRFGPNVVAFTDYQQMLARRYVEAILVAVPLWQHEPVTVTGLRAQKHVFCEKMMSHSIDQCRAINEADKTSWRHLQIGHQRAYNPLYQQAYRLIRNGVIGDIYHVRALWHRNGDWRQRVPERLDMDPKAHGYANLEHLKNWRLYQKYSQGLMAELGSHQLHVVNWFTGSLPTRVMGSGGIYRFQDGREVNDHVFVTFDYPEGLTFTYSSIQSNKLDHYYEQFMGTGGTILLTGEREAMLFSEANTNSEATQIAIEAAADGEPVMSASGSRLGDTAGSSGSAAVSDYNPLQAYRDELAGFCNTIRHGAPNLCTGADGQNACVPILMANRAIEERRPLDITPDLYATT